MMKTVTASLPKLAFASLPSPPPPGSIQFFDGYFSALGAGTYNINLTHTLALSSGNQTYQAGQQVVVQAPEFTIDTTIVQQAFPPAGNSDIYGETLPFIVLSDPALPWERDLIPNGAVANPGNPTPWMALMVFAEGEVVLGGGSSGNASPVTAMTVQQLTTTTATTLGPQLPGGWVSSDVLASNCQVVTITGAAFNAVMPLQTELPYMAHCRGVTTEDEAEALLSVLVANRLPVVSGATPVRFYAFLVSLEGFASYLGPNATPLPTNDGSPVNVQLASFYNWTFTSLPATNLSFEQLVTGLIASESATNGLLELPTPNGNLPATVTQRLQDGYAPLKFVAGSGDETFAWYRGPFSPVVPQPLPQVGSPPVDVINATNADELTIYLEEQGLFDLSYAVAWNIGRNLALNDAHFAQSLNSMRLAANTSVNLIAQRMAMPHFAGENDPRVLLSRDASRTRFKQRVGEGLGHGWTNALGVFRSAAPPLATAATSTATRMRAPRRRGATFHPRELLARADVVAAIGDNIQDDIDTVSRWLAQLALLETVPFSYLVPNPQMLPVESIRFFYIDQGWIDAALAGAMSIALHHSGDVQMFQALRPRMLSRMRQHRRARLARLGAAPSAAASGTAASGMLIRSQLIAGWPQLVINPSLGQSPVTILRNETLSQTVRIALYDGIPDTVTLAEPYQGLQFGVEDNNAIVLRTVTDPAAAGAQIANVTPVTATTRPPSGGAVGGVLNIGTLAPALGTAAGVMPFDNSTVVNWNGTALTTTFVTGNTLTAVVPAANLASSATSPVNVSVTVTTQGVTSAPATFIIDPALVINSIAPPLAIVGSPDLTISVAGAGFSASSAVQWNGTALKTTFISLNEVTAVVPAANLAAAATAQITVAISGGSTTNSVVFPVVTANPVLESLSPSVVVAGGPAFTLTVSGVDFGSDAVAQWNGTALATTFVSENEVTAAVPSTLIAAAGTASITVLTQGATSNALTLTIAGSTPTIAYVEPAAAMARQAGFTISVFGVNFASGSTVQFNGANVTTTWDDSGKVTATVPASAVATAGNVSVVVISNSVASPAATFPILQAQPVIGVLVPPLAVANSGQFTLTVYGGFGAGDFALQMVKAPEAQSFTPENG